MKRLGFGAACLAAGVLGTGCGVVGWINHSISRAIRGAWKAELPEWDDDPLASPLWAHACDPLPNPVDWPGRGVA